MVRLASARSPACPEPPPLPRPSPLLSGPWLGRCIERWGLVAPYDPTVSEEQWQKYFQERATLEWHTQAFIVSGGQGLAWPCLCLCPSLSSVSRSLCPCLWPQLCLCHFLSLPMPLLLPGGDSHWLVHEAHHVSSHEQKQSCRAEGVQHASLPPTLQAAGRSRGGRRAGRDAAAVDEDGDEELAAEGGAAGQQAEQQVEGDEQEQEHQEWPFEWEKPASLRAFCRESYGQ